MLNNTPFRTFIDRKEKSVLDSELQRADTCSGLMQLVTIS